MIIRFTAEEKAELDALDRYYSEKQTALADKMTIDSIDDLKETITALHNCRLEQRQATYNKCIQFEDARFENIKNSPKKILNDAKRQTDFIIKQLQKAVDLEKPESVKKKEASIDNLIQKAIDGSFETEKQILSRIPAVRLPFSFDEIIDDIIISDGEIARLNSQRIITAIKDDLHRHYNRLDTQNTEDLTEYITHTVIEVINNTPKTQDKYLLVTKDKVFTSFAPAIAKKKKITKKNNKGNRKTYIEIGSVRIKLDSSDNAIKHFGKDAFLLFTLANAQFRKYPRPDNVVTLPTIPVLDAMGINTKNKKSVDTAIYNIRHGILKTLRTTAISIDKIDKDKSPNLFDQNFLSNVGINKNRILFTYTPQYADYQRSISTEEPLPLDIFDVDGRDLNSLAMRMKLWDNATIPENIYNGQNKIISVYSLWKETSLPDIEDLGPYKSRWRERIRDKFEKDLDTAIGSDLFTSWHYCKSKCADLTPQERVEADRDYYYWKNNLYICYGITDKELEEKQLQIATKKKKESEQRRQTRERNQIIKAGQALEKLEKAKKAKKNDA